MITIGAGLTGPFTAANAGKPLPGVRGLPRIEAAAEAPAAGDYSTRIAAGVEAAPASS